MQFLKFHLNQAPPLPFSCFEKPWNEPIRDKFIALPMFDGSLVS
jgi:hypothetical protein